MTRPRVLWATPPDRRPQSAAAVELETAATESNAQERIDTLSETDRRVDAAVAAPSFTDGDGPGVLHAVREAWPDAACLLYGDPWAVPDGRSPPVCEIHPATQSPMAVVDAARTAVRQRYHRPYPVFEDERRRLQLVDAADFEVARADFRGHLEDLVEKTAADAATLAVVDDYTTTVVASTAGTHGVVVPRGDTPAAYTIDKPEPITIPDLDADARLPDDTPAYGGDYRSYVGHSLWAESVPLAAVELFADDNTLADPPTDTLSWHVADLEAAIESVL
ncbi:uncharacterized protein NP_3478A [Natronomonas pharaonis DSM 2160]|uniref:Uncharacterized protein n=1 Tax=Natronomonas pharaonis (strain ATCC 35678 / DSM 2160 / CIP 103997 / JCM 8858 / NBRC 14720 / NCIMB 2260 / Gabara) TaxID=348780 RepID=A0A1U7EXB8_NATPD|nr:hypothetical protein [Natronomonas pharaonis]CAI49830.1 uncharacterized protein NP_3478A [Natronomonas pharaonis DSM 2160]